MIPGGPSVPLGFAGKSLDSYVLKDSTPTYRVYRPRATADDGAIYFGSNGTCRFDDPSQLYGVLYVAFSGRAAIAETLIRNNWQDGNAERAKFDKQFPGLAGQPYFLERDLHRKIAPLEITTASGLKLCDFTGTGLLKAGADATVCTGDYVTSQAWSRAIHEHPEQFDGILYHSKYMNTDLSVALFDRSQAKASIVPVLRDATVVGASSAFEQLVIALYGSTSTLLVLPDLP